MIKSSAWDKTLEFLSLNSLSHPLMTVRALECEEWAKSEQFQKILDGAYAQETQIELDDTIESIADEAENKAQENKKEKPRFEFPKFKKKEKFDEADDKGVPFERSVPEEIRKYKELLDEGILSEEEFTAKKKQLLGI